MVNTLEIFGLYGNTNAIANCITIIQWRSKGGGGEGGHAPRGAGLGGASTRFLQSFKTRFKQKFRLKYT